MKIKTSQGKMIICSMSRKGDGWDNAVVECFFLDAQKGMGAR
jgi:hypothetical protein